MGDNVDPSSGNIPEKSQKPQSVSIQSSDLKRAANFLSENDRIGNGRQKYDKYRRYVTLYTQDIFNALVTLYEQLIRTNWSLFKILAEVYPPPAGTSVPTYYARVYISVYFHDLYCTIREATRSISSVAYNQKFSTDVIQISSRYDAYLSLLSASLKPTVIVHNAESTLYIPLLREEVAWDTNPNNPYDITNYAINDDVFFGILQAMEEKKIWKITNLPTNTIGRPFWLFDWHGTEACSWFTRESNYNDEDVALAYIIGVACTPKLGIRDVDSWQFPAGDVPFPTGQTLKDTPRVDPRIFYGSYEVRTCEGENMWFPPNVILQHFQTQVLTPAKKKFRSTSGSSALVIHDSPSTPTDASTSANDVQIPWFRRFRIIDWCYHSRVVEDTDIHTRTGALRIIVLSIAQTS